MGYGKEFCEVDCAFGPLFSKSCRNQNDCQIKHFTDPRVPCRQKYLADQGWVGEQEYVLDPGQNLNPSGQSPAADLLLADVESQFLLQLVVVASIVVANQVF